MFSDEASDEHPFGIRSASDGTRWQIGGKQGGDTRYNAQCTMYNVQRADGERLMANGRSASALLFLNCSNFGTPLFVNEQGILRNYVRTFVQTQSFKQTKTRLSKLRLIFFA